MTHSLPDREILLDVRPHPDLDILTRCEWHPMPFDGERADAVVHRPTGGMVWDAAHHVPDERLPVVERLAAAFALLRLHSDAMHAPAGVLAAFEHIGLQVSPEFAEQGIQAYHLMRTLADLSQGRAVEAMDQELALSALGILWQSAFVAPSGFGHYITRSFAGRVPNRWGFLPDVPRDGDAPLAVLASGLDLLHTAIALHHQPLLRWPNDEASQPNWLAPVAAIESGRGRQRPRPLTVHARRYPLEDADVQTVSVWLGYPDVDRPVAWIQATVLTGQTGAVEEFVELVEERSSANRLLEASEVVSAEVHRQVTSVFANPDVVSIYARVRRLLDRSEHRVHRLLVIEHMGVDPDWRGRALGLRLVQQLLMEAGEVEVAIGRPRLVLPPGLQEDRSIGVQAARAVASMRQAHAWSAFGGEYLINGVMGLALPQIQMARVNALWERQPDV